MRLRALHNKPIYAVVEESCASAAYYIAAAADQVYVDKASIVGSIGVLMDGFGFTGLMDKLGVERRLMTAGANKGFLDPFSPQTEAQRKHAQAMLDQIHSQFIEVVKKGRGDRLKETPEMFSGLFWSGQQAVDLGLADSLGSLDGVARDVVKAPDVIDYTQRENVAERLVKRFGAAVGEGTVRSLRNSTRPGFASLKRPLVDSGADGKNGRGVTIRAFQALFPLRHGVTLNLRRRQGQPTGNGQTCLSL